MIHILEQNIASSIAQSFGLYLLPVCKFPQCLAGLMYGMNAPINFITLPLLNS